MIRRQSMQTYQRCQKENGSGRPARSVAQAEVQPAGEHRGQRKQEKLPAVELEDDVLQRHGAAEVVQEGKSVHPRQAHAEACGSGYGAQGAKPG